MKHLKNILALCLFVFHLTASFFYTANYIITMMIFLPLYVSLRGNTVYATLIALTYLVLSIIYGSYRISKINVIRMDQSLYNII